MIEMRSSRKQEMKDYKYKQRRFYLFQNNFSTTAYFNFPAISQTRKKFLLPETVKERFFKNYPLWTR